MFDFIRAACAVPLVGVGDVEANLNQVLAKAQQAKEAKSDLLVFPELYLTGYACADLFFQKALLAEANRALLQIIKESLSWDFTTVLGMPIAVENQLYNCAIVITNGKIDGIVPKTFLPNYNEFYERRWFSTSCDLKELSLSSALLGIPDQYDIPIGRDLVFNLHNLVRFGVEICEDIWVPIPPSSFLALGGAELIVNLSASNEIIAKHEYRRDLVKQQSARTFTAYVYCSTGGTESTTDLIYSGHSMIAENGSLLKENEQLIDSDYLLVSDIDLGRIRADRMKDKSFKDSATLYGAHEPVRIVNCMTTKTDLHGDGTQYPLRKLPFVPVSQQDRLERCMSIFRMQVAGLKKRLEYTKCKAVVGVSGGLDSTLALLVSTEAIRQLNRPLCDVVGITMPCFGTSDRTYQNALELMKTLGVTAKEINIKEACTLHYQDIGHDINKHDLTFENSQARERTQVLMDVAGQIGGLVVGTGDLSELALGWCTYNADHMSMYNVNASIPKTLIRWMIDSIIQFNIFASSTEVLRDVVDTPISPELLPPDANGKIVQQTEDIVGPYALHDFFLYHMMRFGFAPDKVYYLATLAFKGEYDNKTILKWLRVFYTRFFAQQYKRSCLPDGVKVGSVSLSPRGDWRMPSDASAATWLKQIDALEKRI